MYAEFKHTLLRLRGHIAGWGIAIAALGLLIVAFYGVFQERQADFLKMIQGYPPEFLAFFGGDASTLAKPEGFLGMYGFSMLPLIIGIFAVVAGSGLLASDEESGRLDLMLTYPLSRSAFLWGRVLAFVCATTAILVIGWVGFCVLLGPSALDLTWGEMALPFLSVLAQALIYGALALLLEALLPSRSLAATVAGLVMVASYLLSSMSALDARLASVAQLLPFDYYQSGEALNGLNLAWFLGLMGVSVLFVLLAWWRFDRRDIRVGGERGWRLPKLLRLPGRG